MNNFNYSLKSHSAVLFTILILIMVGCNSREKAQFLSTMSHVSVVKADIISGLDEIQERQTRANISEWNENINSLLEKIIETKRATGEPNLYDSTLPNYDLGLPTHRLGVVFLDASHAYPDKVITISAVVKYPDTNYFVEIRQYVKLNKYISSKQKNLIPDQTLLDPFTTNQSNLGEPCIEIYDKSTNETFCITTILQNKAYIVINGIKLELDIIKEQSTEIPSSNTVKVGDSYNRKFKSGEYIVDSRFTLINRDESCESLRLEYKVDLSIKQGPVTRSYTLFTAYGG